MPAQSSIDDDIMVVPLDDSQGKKFATPPASIIGGSNFRRRRIDPTDLSSPPKPTVPPRKSALQSMSDSQESISLFDSEPSIPSVSDYDPQPSPKPVPSTSTAPPAGSLIRETLTARTSSGKTITISKKTPWKKVIQRQQQAAASKAQKEAYYGVDIHRLLDRIEDEKLQSSLPVHAPAPAAPTRDLWTDKYRATKFVDLLGDERVHRDIMRWLKHWDYCVFGRDIPKASNQPTYTHASSKPKTIFGAVQTVDAYQRPAQKILMLHGPPGLGKTTLAHVAATLAGYEVLEINASDERSGTAARDRIVEAVETVGLDRTGRRGKERCVILDECDGGDAV